MPKAIEIETARLRQWRESDRAPFAAMNADAEVMEFFAALQSREASDASIDAWQSQFAERGWSNWALEVRSSGVFIGFVGLSVPKRVLPFSPCVEVGWRLARPYWGQGYATEGARAALRVGFEGLGLAYIRWCGFHVVFETPDHPTRPPGRDAFNGKGLLAAPVRGI